MKRITNALLTIVLTACTIQATIDYNMLPGYDLNLERLTTHPATTPYQGKLIGYELDFSRYATTDTPHDALPFITSKTISFNKPGAPQTNTYTLTIPTYALPGTFTVRKKLINQQGPVAYTINVINKRMKNGDTLLLPKISPNFNYQLSSTNGLVPVESPIEIVNPIQDDANAYTFTLNDPDYSGTFSINKVNTKTGKSKCVYLISVNEQLHSRQIRHE